MLVNKLNIIAIPSWSIRHIADSKIFFSAVCQQVVKPRSPLIPHSKDPKIEAVAGWGYKKTARRSRRLAARKGVPYISFEDGFFRSVGLGVEGARPLSLVVDDMGVYYDARTESRLEWALNGGISIDNKDRDRAAALLQFIRQQRLTKYNIPSQSKPAWLADSGTGNLLLVDQTRGDASLVGALADKNTFRTMVASALEARPPSQIIVKTHPDVIAGRRKGCIDLKSLPAGVRILGKNVGPWTLFEHIDQVFTVSSQLGFEALIAGLDVNCFGVPFYAGWGLTTDAIDPPRPRRELTLEEMTFCALARYPIYINPFSREICEAETALKILADMRDRRTGLVAGLAGDQPGGRIFLGISKWKRDAIAAFVGPTASRAFTDDQKSALINALGQSIFAWASKIDDRFVEECRAAAIPLVRVEDGFLRSVGLGVQLMPACSLVFDKDGIYYDARTASGLENILQTGDFTADELERAASLRQSVINNRLTKYNVGTAEREFHPPADRPVLLVVGQVEDDASITCSAPDIKTNLGLLDRVRHDNPEAFIIYKPHPDVLTGLRQGAVSQADADRLADVTETGLSSDTLIGISDEIHTLTSLLGFEALIRDKTVHTYGQPFYAGWGLTTDHCAIPRRTRKLALDELVAGTLIRYPAYVDPLSGLLCEPELVVDRLAAGITFASQKGMREKVRRAYNRSIIPRILNRMD